MLDTLNAKPEDFLHIASHTRYDMHPMHDMGFRNLGCWTVVMTPLPGDTTTTR